MLRQVDQNANRTREGLAVEVAAGRDETATFQRLDHLMHRRRGNVEVPLNVALRRREAERRLRTREFEERVGMSQ